MTTRWDRNAQPRQQERGRAAEARPLISTIRISAPTGSGSDRTSRVGQQSGATNSQGMKRTPNSRTSAKLKPVGGFHGVMPERRTDARS